MSLTIVHRDDLEQTGSWSLVRRSLGISSFGVNLVEIAPGAAIPEHDETARDPEVLFVVLRGAATLVVDGVDHPAPAGTFARLDPEPTRTVRNDGAEPAEVLIVSAPRSSGYAPLEWA
jgi:quercetin dioxygenase-like cupin family protein